MSSVGFVVLAVFPILVALAVVAVPVFAVLVIDIMITMVASVPKRSNEVTRFSWP